MSTPVLMPQMGESIAEGTVVRWIKKVGDHVDRDEPLFEISTDKVDAEIPSPAAGVLSEIRVREGETVAVNSVVATIGDSRRCGCRREPDRDQPAQPDSTWLKPAQPDQPVEPRPDPLEPGRTGPVAGGSAEGAFVAAGSPHREGAPRRHRDDCRVRHRRPRDQAGHPRLPRASARAARRQGADAVHPGVPAGRARRDRADGRDAQEDRRAHGAQPADVGPRALGVRGELLARRAAARAEEGRRTSATARS